MSGQFNPIPGNEDIVWRTFIETDRGQYLAAVIAEHGSTAGSAHLYVWSPDTALIHRAATRVPSSVLFGVDRTGDVEWDAEITKVLQNKDYRRIEGVE